MLLGYVNLFSKIVPIRTLTWSIDFPFLYILLISGKILSIYFYLAI